MYKTTIPIREMHCRSCEILIHDELIKIRSVKKVSVNHRKGIAEIFHTSSRLKNHEVITAVRAAGYEIGQVDRKPWISRDIKDYKELAKIFFLIFFLYLLVRKTGITNLDFIKRSDTSSLLVTFLIGLTAGLSTCMALVGGLVLGISSRFSARHPNTTAGQQFRPHLFFNLGRVASYFILGGVIGLAGKAFQLSGVSLGILTILVGIVMLVLGLQLINIFPRLSSGGITLPASISSLIGLSKQKEKEYSHANAIILGAITFFLPCGFTQAMQLYAMSTGSFLSGALIMGVFALGTSFGLLSIGGLTSLIKGSFAKKFFKFAGIIVIFLAVFNILNGYNLTGWKSNFSFLNNSKSSKKESTQSVIKDGSQTIEMEQSSSGYLPNRFTVKKGVPVKWVINSTSAGCASSLSVPSLNIRRALKKGENIVEFTPQKIETIKFSCLMGMYKGTINVVENTSPPLTESSVDTSERQSEDASKPQTRSFKKYGDDAVFHIIKATYSYDKDITPTEFTVKSGQPVRFEIEAEDDGFGCMGTVAIPGLVDDVELFEKGKTVVLEFTPLKTGEYEITCAMGTPRGIIKVR